METLITTIGTQFSAQLRTTDPFGLPGYAPTAVLQSILQSGTGADNANQLFTVQVTLAAGADYPLNLYTMNGATDQVKGAYAMVALKYLMLQITGNGGVFTESDFLTIGGDGSGTSWTAMFGAGSVKVFSGTINLPGNLEIGEGGAAGWPVLNGADCMLNIHNGGANPIQFNLIIVGATA